MVLVKNRKFGHVFIFRKISEKNLFDNILQNKSCFQDYKNEKLKKSKNWDISKGLVHGFGQKCEILPFFYFSSKKTKKLSLILFWNKKNAFKTIKTRS